jgi:hypothetical protein
MSSLTFSAEERDPPGQFENAGCGLSNRIAHHGDLVKLAAEFTSEAMLPGDQLPPTEALSQGVPAQYHWEDFIGWM